MIDKICKKLEGERVNYYAMSAKCDACGAEIDRCAFVFVRYFHNTPRITTLCHTHLSQRPPVMPSNCSERCASYDMTVHIGAVPKGARQFLFLPVELHAGKVSVFEAARNPRSVESDATGAKIVDRTRLAIKDEAILLPGERAKLLK